MVLAQIRIAEGNDHLECAGLCGRHHVLEQRHRLGIRPMQVVEHEAHGHRRRQFHHGACDGREEQESFGLRVGALRLRQIGEPLRQPARQSRKLAAVSLDVPLEQV